MSNNDVPLLSKVSAIELLDAASDADQYDELKALATERAVVIPRRTEEEWTAICAQESGGPDDYAINIDGWLAALRHVGAICPDGKEGV